MEKGKLIVVEGACDGVEKSTQCSMLYAHLRKDGEEIINHHFPSYGTYQAKPVEMYLNGEYGNIKDLSPYFVNSLYAVDRAITWHTILGKKYDLGYTILLDRYTTSSIIYQSALIEDVRDKVKFIDYVVDFEYRKLGIKEPDSVIFLHAPFDLITKIRNARKTNDGISNDIHEREIEFMEKVYKNSTFVANYLSWNIIECGDSSMMSPIDDIHREIYSLVRKK